jgi:hypothetical protein
MNWGKPTRIRAGEDVYDVLVFEKPVGAATRIHITLDASAYGSKGILAYKYEIGRSKKP